MGTRSLTRVFEEGAQLVCLYRQMDGYLSGHGKELFDFLKDRRIGNGLGLDADNNYSNGAGCLAASLIAHFKTEPGGFYLMPINTKDAGQDYEYHIRINIHLQVTVDVIEGSIGYSKRKYHRAMTVAQFGEFCITH